MEEEGEQVKKRSTKGKTVDATKKYRFEWTPNQQALFEAVRDAVASISIFPADDTLQFHLVANESQLGRGARLF